MHGRVPPEIRSNPQSNNKWSLMPKPKPELKPKPKPKPQENKKSLELIQYSQSGSCNLIITIAT